MRHSDNCLGMLLSTLSFPSQSIWKALDAGLPSQCPAAKMWTSVTLTQTASCHKFPNFLWAGASLARRKWHSVAKKTHIFPLNHYPRFLGTTCLLIHLWLKMKPLQMAGWDSDCLLSQGRDAGGTALLELHGAPESATKSKSQRAPSNQLISPQNGGVVFNVEFEVKQTHVLMLSSSVHGCLR